MKNCVIFKFYIANGIYMPLNDTHLYYTKFQKKINDQSLHF